MINRVFRRAMVLLIASAAIPACATSMEDEPDAAAHDAARQDGARGDSHVTPTDAARPDGAAVVDAMTADDAMPDPVDVVTAPVDTGPACLVATQPCTGSECCEGLTCGTTSLGQVCCGNEGAPCATADGSDCCGALECVSGHCAAPACLPSMHACSGGGCCAGLTCGTTSLGQVCCGESGAPCATADGSDCCGALECVSGHCGFPSGVLPSCTESAILAAVSPAARPIIDRALDWVHRAAPYSQTPQSAFGGYRTDCSGLVAMSWGRPAPGETTYSFAGGPWYNHSSVQLGSWNDLAIGDATNYPGDPSAGTGHIRLFAGWLDSAHTQYCSIEEYDYGHVAEIRSHPVNTSAYIPIRLAGFSP